MGTQTLVNWAWSALLLSILIVRETSSSDVFMETKTSADDELPFPMIPNDIMTRLQSSGDSATIEDVQPETLSDILVKSIIEELAGELRRKTATRKDPILRGIYCGNGSTAVIEPYLLEELIIYQQRASHLTKQLLETYATSHSFKSWSVLAARHHHSSDVALVPLLPALPSEEPSYYRIEVKKEPGPHPHHAKNKMHFDKDFFQEKSGTHRSPAVLKPLLLEGQREQAQDITKVKVNDGTNRSPTSVDQILLEGKLEKNEVETHTFMSLDPSLVELLQSQLRTVQFHTAAIEQVTLDQVMNGGSKPGVLRELHRVQSGLERLSEQLLRTLSECRLEPERGHVDEVLGAVYQRVDGDGALVRGVRTLRQTLRGLEYYKSCLTPIVQ